MIRAIPNRRQKMSCSLIILLSFLSIPFGSTLAMASAQSDHNSATQIQSASEEELFRALENPNAEAVKRVLTPANINSFTKSGLTPLMMAARYRAYRPKEKAELTEIVRLLFSNKADVNQKDKEGRTALMIAASRGNLDLIKQLEDNGADLKAKDNSGDNALNYALEGGYLQVANYFYDKGISKEIGTEQQTNLIHTAVIHDNIPALEDLLSKGIKATFINLREAASRGKPRAIEILLENGLDVNDSDDDGKTALMAAAQTGEADAVRVLLRNGADISKKDNQGRTALMIASERQAAFQWRTGRASFNQVLSPFDQKEVKKFDETVSLLKSPSRKDALLDTKSYVPSRLLKAADEGDILTQIKLGKSYYYGLDNIEKNLLEAFFWFSACSHQTKNLIEDINIAKRRLLLPTKAFRSAEIDSQSQEQEMFREMMRPNTGTKKTCNIFLTTLNESLSVADRASVQPRIEAWTKAHPVTPIKELSANEKRVNFLTDRLALELSGSSYDIRGIRTLVKQGADVKGHPGMLTLAAKAGTLDIVQAFVEAGVNVNAGKKNGSAALAVAMSHDHQNVIKYLVSKGAKVQRNNISSHKLSLQERSEIKEYVDHPSNIPNKEALAIFQHGKPEDKDKIIKKISNDPGLYSPLVLKAMSTALFDKFEDAEAISWALFAELKHQTDYAICPRKDKYYISPANEIMEYYKTNYPDKLAKLAPEIVKFERQISSKHNRQWGDKESICLAPSRHGDIQETQRAQFLSRYSLDNLTRYTGKEDSMDELIPLAESGDKEAQYRLGNCYLNWRSCDLPIKEQQRIYDHQAAQELSQQGQSSKMFSGLGLDEEYKPKAMEWLEKSAKQKYIPAMKTLAQRYAISNDQSRTGMQKFCNLLLELQKLGDNTVYKIIGMSYWNKAPNRRIEEYAWGYLAHEASQQDEIQIPLMQPYNMSEEDLKNAEKRGKELVNDHLVLRKPICEIADTQ